MLQARLFEQSVAFFQQVVILCGRSGLQTDQKPDRGMFRSMSKSCAQMIMQASPQSIPDHGALADLAADHHSHPAGRRCEWDIRLTRSCLTAEQAMAGRSPAQHHQGAVKALASPVQVIKAAMATQTHGCRQDHRWNMRESNGQA